MNSEEKWIPEAISLCEEMEKLHIKLNDTKNVNRTLSYETDEESDVQNDKNAISNELLTFMKSPILPIARTLSFNECEMDTNADKVVDKLWNDEIEQARVFYTKVLLDTQNESLNVDAANAVTYSGNATISNNQRLKIVLAAPKNRNWNRMYRKFGAHRFLKVNVGSSLLYKDKQFISKHFGIQAKMDNLIVCGRQYECLHVKPSGGGNACVLLFAVKSKDENDYIKPISIQDVRNWHIPIVDNPNMSIYKYNARMDMGFSTTMGGGVVEKIAIHCIDDEYSTTGQVMTYPFFYTDGCGFISKELMIAVAHKANWKRPFNSIEKVPSAFQGRLGACKGVWILNPLLEGKCIYVRKSMQKYTLHHADRQQRTIEVVKFAQDHGSGKLNRQFIALFDALVTPENRQHLLTLQAKELKLLGTIFKNENRAREFTSQNMDDPDCRLAYWMLNYKCWQDPMLNALLESARKRRVDAIVNKSKITIPKSGRYFIIPDPTGTLQENQIYLQTTFNKKCTILGSVIICRNPAYHPGDVQKLDAVDIFKVNSSLHPEWKDALVNVIVLSTKGDRPVANMLSGGDYDGDEAWICWDSNLVSIVNPVKPMIYEIKQHQSKPSNTIIYAHEKLILSNLLFKTYQFVFESQRKLGIVSNWHLLRADWSPNGVLDPGCIEMSRKISCLVDSAKTGCSVSLPSKYKDCNVPHWYHGGMKNASRVLQSVSLIGNLYDDAHVWIKAVHESIRAEGIHCFVENKIVRENLDAHDPKQLATIADLVNGLYSTYEGTFYNAMKQVGHTRSTMLGASLDELRKQFLKLVDTYGNDITVCVFYDVTFLRHVGAQQKKQANVKFHRFVWDVAQVELQRFIEQHNS